jgi:hypothetical protein
VVCIHYQVLNHVTVVFDNSQNHTVWHITVVKSKVCVAIYNPSITNVMDVWLRTSHA